MAVLPLPAPQPGCPEHCSGNGYCDSGTVCKCYPGWEGRDCAAAICSKGCSGHGTCDANNTCRCDEGWSGYDCSLSECADGCSGIGISPPDKPRVELARLT